MKFKIECWFKFKDELDYECFAIEATDPEDAFKQAKKKYPTATRVALTKKSELWNQLN